MWVGRCSDRQCVEAKGNYGLVFDGFCMLAGSFGGIVFRL